MKSSSVDRQFGKLPIVECPQQRISEPAAVCNPTGSCGLSWLWLSRVPVALPASPCLSCNSHDCQPACLCRLTSTSECVPVPCSCASVYLPDAGQPVSHSACLLFALAKLLRWVPATSLYISCLSSSLLLAFACIMRGPDASLSATYAEF